MAVVAPAVVGGVRAPLQSITTRFTVSVELPEGAGTSRVWVPVPTSDAPMQDRVGLKVKGAAAWDVYKESKYGNEMVSFVLSPGEEVDVVYAVKRDRFKQGKLKTDADVSKYLEPDRLVPIDGRYAEIGKDVAGMIAGAKAKTRAIYDHVLANMEYDYNKESPKLGEGDVAFVCDYKKGNCSDLHSYLISLLRSQGVPAFLEYGFPVTGIPMEVKKSGQIGGYHCWTWAYVNGEWMPIDASDAKKWEDLGNPKQVNTLFGGQNIERAAVGLVRGRDIDLNPKQVGDSLNVFIYPYGESNGESVDVQWSLGFEVLGGK